MSNAAYIAIAPCGCVHGIDLGDGLETAKQITEWIDRGSTVARVPGEEASQQIVARCPHDPKWGRA